MLCRPSLKTLLILCALVWAMHCQSGCASVSDSTFMTDELVQSLLREAFADRLDHVTTVAHVSRGQVVQVWRIDHDGKLTSIPIPERQASLAQVQSCLKPRRDCFWDTSYYKVALLDIDTPAQATAMLCEGGGDLRAGLCDEMRLAQASGQWHVLSQARTAGRGPCQCKALWPVPTPTRQRTNEP